jgi:hypothetical protein
MGKFISLRCNGRARIVLILALLIPPLPTLLLALISVDSIDFSTILLLWSALAVVVVFASYAMFAISRMLSWMIQGLDADELYSWRLMGRWVIGVLVILTAFVGFTFLRYEIIPVAWSSHGAYYKYDRLTGRTSKEWARNESGASEAATPTSAGIHRIPTFWK